MLAAFAAAVLLSSLALSAGACAPLSQQTDDGRLKVVATIFAPFDFARVLGGEAASVSMLLPPGTEVHSFDPTPRTLIAIQEADVFIYVGGESDAWVHDILESMDTASLQVVALMDCVETVAEETVMGRKGEEGGEPLEKNPDEHVWTSPRNAKLIVARIAQALVAADQANAAYYTANASAYTQELDALDAAFTQIAQNARRTTAVFGDRFPFRYLFDAYGFDYYAAFPGCSGESEPSARTVAFLINKVRDEALPVVFHVELGNTRMAQTIAEDTGAQVRELHAAHTIASSDFAAGRSYLDIQWTNVAALQEAFL